MNVLMGRNMMRKDGDEHRRERFVYYPAVSPKKVKAYWAGEFDRLTDRVLETILDDVGPGDTIDLVPSMPPSTLDCRRFGPVPTPACWRS